MRTSRIHAVTCSIAHSIVSIQSLSTSEQTFLSEKYADYIVNTTKKPDIRIVVCKHKQTFNSRISNTKWQVFTPSISHNFLDFNQELRFILSEALLIYGGALLHGSVMHKDGQAYVFLGPEGAGKSTMRELLEPEYACLGDDSVFLRIIRNTLYVFGSPLYQRTNRTYPNIRVKVSGIFKLQQEQFHALERISERELLLHLCKNIVTTDLEKGHLEQIYRIALVISSHATGFTVSFKKDRGIAAMLPHAKKLFAQHMPDLSKLPSPLNLQTKRFKKKVLVLFSPEILEHIQVIEEVGWQFEFPHMRTVREIASYVKQHNISGKHTEIIRSLQSKKSSLRSKVFTLIKEGSSYTLLDGNHHAIAIYMSDTKLPYIPTLLLGDRGD